MLTLLPTPLLVLCECNVSVMVGPGHAAELTLSWYLVHQKIFLVSRLTSYLIVSYSSAVHAPFPITSSPLA